jgi:hypothetical protein
MKISSSKHTDSNHLNSKGRGWAVVLLLFLITIPIRAWRMETVYGMENGKMLVRASVNGVEGRFVIDTGAPCSITHTFAQRAGLQGGQTTQVYDSNGNTVRTTIVNLPNLSLGGFSFTRLQAMQLPEGNMIEQFGVDGIVGYNLLRQGIVKFVGRDHRLILTNDTTDLGIDLNYGILLADDPYSTMVPIRVGNVVDTVMFDTGALDFYEMSNRMYTRVQADTTHFRRLASGKGILSMGAAGLEAQSLKHRVLIPQSHIGNIPFANVTTITTDALESRIGSNVLMHGDVIIDYREKMFYFQPFTEVTEPINVYQPEWDVVITVMGDHLVAGMVWDNAKGDIQSGDRIVAIGSERVDKVDLRQATTQAWAGLKPEGTQITYVSSKTGNEQTMTISMK